MSNTFLFYSLFPVLSIELCFICTTSAFRTCPCKNMVYHSPARDLCHTRSFNFTRRSPIQPKSKIQQPPRQRTSSPRFQTDRHQCAVRTIQAFRQAARNARSAPDGLQDEGRTGEEAAPGAPAEQRRKGGRVPAHQGKVCCC